MSAIELEDLDPAPSGLGRRAAAALAAAGGMLQRDNGRAGVVPELMWAPWELERVLRRVRKEFGERRISDHFPLVTESDGLGRLHVLTDICPLPRPCLPSPADAAAALRTRLELVRGIGPVTASRLRGEGIVSLDGLTPSPRYAAEAAEVCAELDRFDLLALGERLRRRLAGRGHLLSALLSGCVELSEIVFFDLETLGLANLPIFLCGFGRFVDGTFRLRQYLTPSYADEPAMISRAVAELEDARIVVTYNGRTADMVWMRARSFFHGLLAVPELAHIDLMFGTRRRYVVDEALLENARLPVVQQQLLGESRPRHDVPSSCVPHLYEEYVRTGSDGLLVPILEHNRSDIVTLVTLLERLCDAALSSCR